MWLNNRTTLFINCTHIRFLAPAVGEHLAYAFAERGANLVLAARRTDKLEKVAQQCRRSGSPETVVRFLDVTQFDSHKKFVEEIIDQQGAVDILVRTLHTIDSYWTRIIAACVVVLTAG